MLKYSVASVWAWVRMGFSLYTVLPWVLQELLLFLWPYGHCQWLSPRLMSSQQSSAWSCNLLTHKKRPVRGSENLFRCFEAISWFCFNLVWDVPVPNWAAQPKKHFPCKCIFYVEIGRPTKGITLIAKKQWLIDQTHISDISCQVYLPSLLALLWGRLCLSRYSSCLAIGGSFV